MAPEKVRNYVGLLFVVPVCLLFLWPDYWSSGFELAPRETAIFDVLSDLIGGPTWSRYRTATWLWWALFLVSLGVIWRWRATLGGLLVRSAASVHNSV